MTKVVLPLASADSGALKTRPQDWDRAVSVAFFRSVGSTQIQAAEAAGVSERTVRAWEHSPFWADALAEAKSRWLNGAVTVARATLLRGLEDDPRLALDFLSRVDPRLHPRAALEHRVPEDRHFFVEHVTSRPQAREVMDSRSGAHEPLRSGD